MRTLTEQLSGYAAYHRDRRNIVTHFVGIPMIMVAVEVLLSRTAVVFDGVGIVVTPALVVGLASVIFYLALDRRYGLVMTAGSDFHDPRYNTRGVGMDVEESDLRPFLDLVA